jgi:hypothetical protein
MISSSTCHCLFGAAAPASSRVMSSKFSTKRARWRDSSAIDCSVSRRAGSLCSECDYKMLEIAAAMTANGVRKSCETELNSELRSSSAWTRTLASLASMTD